MSSLPEIRIRKRQLSDTSESDEGGASGGWRGSTESVFSDSDSQARTKIEFKFWNKEDTSDLSPVEDEFPNIRISEISAGNYWNDCVQFRVTYKGELKDSANGRHLTFHGLDESAEIKFIGFRKEAEMLNTKIEVNQTYLLKGFKVEEDSKKFPSGTGNKWQIMLNSISKISIIQDDKVPAINFKFVDLKEVKKMEAKTKIDVLGVLVRDWDLKQTSKGQSKRDLTITDSSKAEIIATLWGEHAENFQGDIFSVVALRKASVSDYFGTPSINVGVGSLVLVNPNLGEATGLKEWFDKEVEQN